jgi:class 3 adenylate cyclase/tetratricopeptide (TPR) repeat protein
MDCPSCGHPNPAGARFCGGCATPLQGSSTCPRCGAANASGQRFCNACGQALEGAADPLAIGETPAGRDPRSYTPEHLAEKIRAGRAALEGERKQVTVLFADVMGSLQLAERSDPEDWRRIMDRFFSILCEGVHRFEGTVDKFTGDGIMALFGAPVAHEDHARRACDAALNLQLELDSFATQLRPAGLSFSVRMGLNSGEVVVGRIGEDLGMEYTAIGHTVGLAQRMEALAEPGHAYLTEHTARLVDGWFALRDLGPVEVKGAGAPLRAYVLEGVGTARSSFHVARARGLSRLVGREQEMAALESALARAQEGHAQVVGVVGEAGVGKSRLCEEFAEACTARGITVRRGHGSSYGKHMPLQPMLELLRDYFEIVDSDRPERARKKIAERLVPLGASIEDDVRVFFDFMEVADPEHPLPPLSAEERMRRVFDVVRRVAPRRSERGALVLLVEDLHWFDAASVAFLEQLIESYPGTRTLVVTNFRPEFHASWMRHSYYRQVALSPLSSEEVRSMVVGLLGEDVLSGDLVESLAERTSGNPFFLEEVVRSLIEDGTLEGSNGEYTLTRSLDRVRVPATVQAIVGARIDRLPQDAKDILQSASVIGRTFSEPIVQRIVGRPEAQLRALLRSLCSAEFLSEEAIQPAAEYRFWHPLTQEVAYGSLLSERRRRIHAAVAAALLEGDPEGSGEQAALVAHHWQEAGEAALAARWHWRAAEWATYRDPLDAIRRWRVMLELLEGLEPTAETLELGVMARARLLRVGGRMGLSTTDRRELYEQGRKVAERSPDPKLLAHLVWSCGASYYMAGELREAQPHLLEGVRIADEIGDVGLASALRIGAVVSIVTGPLSSAIEEAQSGIDLARDDPELGKEHLGYSPLVRNTLNRSMAYTFAGRLDQARADAEWVIETARRREELELIVIGLYAMNLWAFHAGDSEGALVRARETVQAAEMSTRYLHTYAREGMGMACLLSGRPDDAITALESAVALVAKGVGGFQEPSILALLSASHAAAGNARQAFDAAEEAVDAARDRGARVFEGHALIRRAGARRLLGQPEELVAEDLGLARRAIEDSGAHGFAPFLLDAERDQGLS